MSKVRAPETRTRSGIQSGKSLRYKAKSKKLHGHENVNTAGIWDEGHEVSRTGGNGVRNLVETRFIVRSQQKP